MSAPSWAVPGAKVVCVDASPAATKGTPCPLREKAVYTIREVVDMADYVSSDDRIGIRLVEAGTSVWRDSTIGPWECPYGLHRFRPLVSKTIEQDMEHFLPLLNTVGEDA